MATLLKAMPERSDRAIAGTAKVDHKTVAAVRADQEARGEIPHVSTRVDTVGRQQAATKPAPEFRALRENAVSHSAPRPSTSETAAPKTPTASSIAAIARDIERTLREWRLRRAEIDAMPLAGRVAHARALLQVLDVTVDDLAPIGGTP